MSYTLQADQKYRGIVSISWSWKFFHYKDITNWSINQSKINDKSVICHKRIRGSDKANRIALPKVPTTFIKAIFQGCSEIESELLGNNTQAWLMFLLSTNQQHQSTENSKISNSELLKNTFRKKSAQNFLAYTVFLCGESRHTLWLLVLYLITIILYNITESISITAAYFTTLPSHINGSITLT